MTITDSYLISLFKPHIWRRGTEISRLNINITYQSANEIRAIVSGTKDYDVLISFNDYDDVYMQCTCPYASGGDNCKHMAAVLFGHMESPTERDSQSEIINKLLQQLSKEDINNFMLDAIMNSRSLKKLFMASFFPKSITVDDILSEFDAIYQRYSGRDGYVNYYNTYDFFREVDTLMDQVDALIKNGELLAAVKVISQLSEELTAIDLDDSDGGMSIFLSGMIERVESIMDEEDEEANKFLHTWMNKIIEKNKDYYLADLLYPLWSSNYTSAELIDIRINQIMKRWGLPRNKNGNDEESYSFCSDLIEMAKLMEKRGDKELDIEKILLPFKGYEEILDYLAESAKQSGQRDKEEELLLEGVQLDKQNKMTADRFKEKLCRLYQDTNREEEYRSCLRDLVINEKYKIDYYLEYKALFSQAEWQHKVPLIIEEISRAKQHKAILLSIYNEEKMYQDLLELVGHEDIASLKKYEAELIKYNQEKVVSLYCEYLDRLAARSASNDLYWLIVEEMQHIRKLPGGEALMKEKAHMYSIKYKARRNFLARLNEVEW